MSTKIRLRRMGKKKQPFYRIVVADSRSARDARAIEEIGTYNPVARPGRVEIKESRVFEWLDKGAQPTDTVASLFRRIGVMNKWTLHKAGQDISGIELKTELVETAKPKGRKKQTARTEAATETEKAEAPAEEAAAGETTAVEEAPAEEKAEAPADESPADEEKKEA